MNIIMNLSRICTIAEIEDYLQKNGDNEHHRLSTHNKTEWYEWIDTLLHKVSYHKLCHKEKRSVRAFIQKLTGYSNIQMKRLIIKQKKGELVYDKRQRNSFARYYQDTDIALLHHIDSVHQLSGKATKKIIARAYWMFGKVEYRKLKEISVSHIYNIRGSKHYQRMGVNFKGTKSVDIPIGIRMKPRPHGKPGYIRVDSVHQGDYERIKGVYFVNLVDEVTQMEWVFCVHSICAENIENILKVLLRICPYHILNFHSDNGSEFINKLIASMLNGEKIRQTKSRPRKHNDNALVESKNGSVIRKMFGYFHIPATRKNAEKITAFCLGSFIPYLNFHRPCAFAKIKIDKKGKQKKTYPYKNYCTPYEKLKSLPNAKQYLREGVTFEELDKIAYKECDTEFAEKMNVAKKKLFKSLDLNVKNKEKNKKDDKK